MFSVKAGLTKFCSSVLDLMNLTFEQIMGKVLLKNSTQIVATTLGASANEILRLGFRPDVLVYDGFSNVTAEHVIAMTMESLKAVIFIGDPGQMRYLQRPLKSRLRHPDYLRLLQRLDINYQCHTSILAFFNKSVYHGQLKAGPRNDEVKRVGAVWDYFTATSEAFRAQHV